MDSEVLRKIKAEFAAADQRMLQAEKDLDKLQAFIEEFEAMSENLDQLADFYYNQNWVEKRRILERAGMANFGSASEDGIWNLHFEFRAEKVNLLKKITDDIYKDTFKED